MRETNPNSLNPLSVKIDTNPVFSGLDEFMKGLERLFFAEATAKSWMSENGSEDLVLHISSPISMLEALHHHRRGHWGAIPSAGTGAGISRLEEMLRALEACNGRPVEIEELSLELKDVLVVVRRNHSQSIAREFDLLLETLAAHFVYLTRGMMEMPYEIHIPVLEDGPEQDEALSAGETSGYYAYWGVYFESGIEAKIYDLQNRQLLDAELHFGNLPPR